MTDDPDLSEIATRNRSLWDERSAEYQEAHGGQPAALDNSAGQLAHADSLMADAKSSYRDDTDRDWAQRWPMEHIWRVRRAADISRR